METPQSAKTMLPGTEPRLGPLTCDNVRPDFYRRMENVFRGGSFGLKPGEAKRKTRGVLNALMAFAVESENSPELLSDLARWGEAASDPLQFEQIEPTGVSEIIEAKISSGTRSR